MHFSHFLSGTDPGDQITFPTISSSVFQSVLLHFKLYFLRPEYPEVPWRRCRLQLLHVCNSIHEPLYCNKSSQVKFNNQLCGQSGRIAMNIQVLLPSSLHVGLPYILCPSSSLSVTHLASSLSPCLSWKSPPYSRSRLARPFPYFSICME